MTLTRLMRAAALLALLAAPAHAEPDPAPAAAAELAPAHARDVRELMEILRTHEWLIGPPIADATLSAADREFDSAFRRQITPDETYRRLAPVYARFLNARQSADLLKLVRTSGFRKRELRAQQAGGGLIYPGTFLSPAEMTELRRVDAAPAVLNLRAMQKKLRAETGDEIKRWARQFDERMNDKARDVLRKVDADLDAARAAGDARTITIGRVGLPYMDKVVWISGSAMIKMSNAYRHFDGELKYLGFQDILKPDYLGSKLSLAHSRSVVEQVEAALEKLLKDTDQTIKERDAALREVESPRMSNYLKSVEAGTGDSYGYMVEFGEAYRRMLDEYRRLLNFVAAHQADVQYQDGKLLFANDADLATARDIFARIEQAGADLQALVERQTKKDEARQQGRGSAAR
ncbi:MAG: hypothetical protein V4484_23255 [Pseudomonadota bacterium]